jgi:hypothetical protein
MRSGRYELRGAHVVIRPKMPEIKTKLARMREGRCAGIDFAANRKFKLTFSP